MAEDTFGLFNTQTPGAMRQAYMAQMQPSLKDLMMAPDYGSRLIGLMGGAAGGLGVSSGSLLGGRTAAEAEMALMDEAKKEAAQIGTDEESRMAAFVSALRKRGLEGYAMQATKELDRVMKAKAELLKTRAETTATEALAKQRGREANPVLEIAKTGKYTPESIQRFASSGKVEDLVFKESDDKTQVVETAEGQILINKSTGEQIANIGKSPERGTKVTVSPTIKLPPQIVDAVNAFDKTIQPYQEVLDLSGKAKDLINESIKSNNSQTWEAARTTIAKAVGENKLSNEDIRRTGVDPRLVQGALDWVNKKVVGVPTADIQKQLYALASILEKDATEKINKKATRVRAAAKEAGFEGNIETYFPKAGEKQDSGVTDWSKLK